MKHSLILLMLSSGSLLASIGEVSALRGTADLIRESKVQALKIGTKLEVHDKIKTNKNTKLQIIFNDKTVISLGQKSTFKIDDYIYSKDDVKAKFTIGKGFFKSITGKIGKIAPSHFKVKTANATIGVRGTTIIGETSKKMDIIACTFGQIVVTSDLGSVIVNKGERTIVSDMKAPTQAQKVNSILLKQLDQKSTLPHTQEQSHITTMTPSIKIEQKMKNKTSEEEKENQKFSLWIQKQTEQSLSLDDIQKVVGTSTPIYKGKIVEGTTGFGEIKQNEANNVHLGFDLGAGTMEGKLQFQDTIQNYDIDVAGRIKDDASFDFNSQNGYNGGGSGKLSGERYEQANGNFAFEEENLFNQQINKIKGKFETTKK